MTRPSVSGAYGRSFWMNCPGPLMAGSATLRLFAHDFITATHAVAMI